MLSFLISIFVGWEEDEIEDDNGSVNDSNDSCIGDVEGEVGQIN